PPCQVGRPQLRGACRSCASERSADNVGMNRTSLAICVVGALSAHGCSGSNKAPRGPEAPAAGGGLPEACPPDRPSNQSPAGFGAGGIEPEVAATCDTANSGWVACQQHMHCGAEHSGAGICPGASAGCEVHTVYHRRKDGGQAAAVPDLHQGTIADNCDPANN